MGWDLVGSRTLGRQDVTLTPLHINTLLYNLLVGLKYLHSAQGPAPSDAIARASLAHPGFESDNRRRHVGAEFLR